MKNKMKYSRLILLLMVVCTVKSWTLSTQCTSNIQDYSVIHCKPGASDMATAIAQIRFFGHQVKSLSCDACGITDPYSVLNETVDGIEEIRWFDSKVISANINKLHDLKTILLQNITEIDLKETDLRNLPKLQSLSMSRIYLPYLPKGFFQSIKHIQSLRISGVNLQKLKKRWFYDMVNLYSLDLSYNRISVLKPDMLKDTKLLTNLELQYNRITSIPADFFRNLERLEKCNIAYNPILSLNMDGLFKHPHLWQLHFQRIPCLTIEKKIVPYLHLVSANLTVQKCRNSAEIDCLVLKRDNLHDLELKDYISGWEKRGVVSRAIFMEDLREDIPCINYCSDEIVLRDYGNEDPLNMKKKVEIMMEAVSYLRKHAIFNIEGLAALPMLEKISTQLDPFIEYHDKYY